jgi:hypothetical protein
MARGKINKNILEKEIFSSKSLQKQIKSLVTAQVQKQKNVFLEEFENHPVTKELDAGQDSSNISGTLGGYGNLFSFLGFSSGSTPTLSVKSLIKKIYLNPKIKVKSNILQFKVNIPSKEEFAAISRMPWESGRSWLLDIERGISGLGSYLYGRFENSRSGSGIQVSRYNNKVYKPVKYFSQIYNNFLKKIGAK